MSPRLAFDSDKLREFCLRWSITELAFFGSVLSDDFGPESDVDVLISFPREARWTLLDHVQMRDELIELFGRDVDLLTRRSVERSRNHLRRKEILSTAQVVYAS